MGDSQKQNENEHFYYADNNVNNSVQNQNNEPDFQYIKEEIPKKVLVKKWSLAAFLILLITLDFGIVAMVSFGTFVTNEYTTMFSFFVSAVIFVVVTAIYIKMREVIRIKDIFMFFLFSAMCAVTVFMQDKILYIAAFILSVAAAVIVAVLLDTSGKKVFIPFMAVFMVLNLLTGTEKLFMAQNIDFTADYFYFSSQSEVMPSEAPHYYSTERFSSDDISDFSFYSFNSVIKNSEQFQKFLDETSKNGEQNKVCEDFCRTLKKSETQYDNEFFSKYNLLICSYTVAAVSEKLDISSVNINVKNKELKIYGNAEFSSSEYEKYKNGGSNGEICIMFIKVEKSQALPDIFEKSQIYFEPVVS
ncbi:MAG: hypothetical protein PUG48_07770 [Clostridia bacterium]|nr:hypothetical protein [Clostridia bacterium]